MNVVRLLHFEFKSSSHECSAKLLNLIIITPNLHTSKHLVSFLELDTELHKDITITEKVPTRAFLLS